ncbi:MAG: hypothetical protein VKP62_04805 [Candidatus Sericytochromatia bacterium]|nr:hypothetical protein [Candidatus Sericytochromatia bacterium]
MKKDDAMAWMGRLAELASQSLRKSHGTAPVMADRLFHDEVDGQARWAFRLAAPSWPFRAGGAGELHRPGLRLEVWFHPGKAPDAPIDLVALCAGEEALSSLREGLVPVWQVLHSGGKAAGRYKPLAEVLPLALRFDREATGIARRMPPVRDKVEAAFTQLLLDALPPLDRAVALWQSHNGEQAFVSEAPDPLAALRKHFGGH